MTFPSWYYSILGCYLNTLWSFWLFDGFWEVFKLFFTFWAVLVLCYNMHFNLLLFTTSNWLQVIDYKYFTTSDKFMTFTTNSSSSLFPPSPPPLFPQCEDSITATGSLILIHQLEDKMKAHERLVSFLKNSGLWERVSIATIKHV